MILLDQCIEFLTQLGRVYSDMVSVQIKNPTMQSCDGCHDGKQTPRPPRRRGDGCVCTRFRGQRFELDADIPR